MGSNPAVPAKHFNDLIPTKRTYSSLFLVSLATLMYEVLLTRIFSVTMWYHFAFVAISVAMFGASVGAIAVYVFPRRFPVDRTHQLLALSAMLFAAASVVSFAVHVRLPFLAENSLYTLEAWKTFLERLKPGGILTVSRWNFPDPPGEVYRMVSLASAALRQRGVGNPRDHMMIARRMGPRMSEGLLYGVATLLVSPDPFNEADLRMLESVSQKLGFEIVLSPRHALDTTFAGLSSGEDPEIYSQRYRLNLLPPTDDKPYFFHLLRLNDALGFGFWNQPGVGYYLNAVFILVPLLITVAVLTVLCILLPLWLKRDSGSFRQAGPLLIFFSAIGVGFMLVEISQLQRLMVFLGHPSYALSVVLFALLLSSGLGSLSSARISPILARGPSLWPLLLLLVVLLVFGATTPHILSTYQGSVTPLRVVIATVILFPTGFLMGTAFPLGMRVATIRFPTLTPWFWGVNGAASVLSSVLAVVIALTFGISAAFWTGFSSYCAAALAIAVASRSGPKRLKEYPYHPGNQ